MASKKDNHLLIQQTHADPFSVPGSVASLRQRGAGQGPLQKALTPHAAARAGIDNRAGICQARKGGRGMPSRGNISQRQAKEALATQERRAQKGTWGRTEGPGSRGAASRGENVPSLHL